MTKPHNLNANQSTGSPRRLLMIPHQCRASLSRSGCVPGNLNANPTTCAAWPPVAQGVCGRAAKPGSASPHTQRAPTKPAPLSPPYSPGGRAIPCATAQSRHAAPPLPAIAPGCGHSALCGRGFAALRPPRSARHLQKHQRARGLRARHGRAAPASRRRGHGCGHIRNAWPSRA